LFCGNCVKFKMKKKCPKIKTVSKTTLACSQGVLDVKRITPELMETAMELGKMPSARIRLLMSLLDAELRLRPRCMSLGLIAPYTFKPDGKKKSMDFRVHLVAYPRDAQDKAYGVAFPAKPLVKGRRGSSFYINKTLFKGARDSKLIAIWDKLEQSSMYMDTAKKKKVITKVIKTLGRKKSIKMLELSNVSLGFKGIALEQRKIGDIINGLYKYL